MAQARPLEDLTDDLLRVLYLVRFELYVRSVSGMLLRCFPDHGESLILYEPYSVLKVHLEAARAECRYRH